MRGEVASGVPTLLRAALRRHLDGYTAVGDGRSFNVIELLRGGHVHD